ncbi:D-xylose transport system substrate-binding protein [Sediminihabitans luteus]|uniref:D-xylose transport system substrate-binding protein n=1 Tax=Sediminihabitans luteus TaxID=1138585 RepID=A0A2M9CF37_9CELL|nr:substrate-binding domain-containing protein [Sediminihabitans luteus]PJJ70472.1 D-xylose transport system substrate-binding protein [Sediminihabitans luteus]GII97945.1 ABC transporter substrate-binding protein [Sediminihabitans luteus]
MRAARRASALGGVLAGVLVLAGCSGPDASGVTPAPDEPGAGTIGLLLPESKTARYEATDRPAFESVVGQRCEACTVLAANADQDAAVQQEQAESMIARGVDLLVLDAVDTVAATSIVDAAERHGIPVVAYDRYIDDPAVDYYVSFDSELVGYLQGEAVLAELEAEPAREDGHGPGVLLVGGSSTDPNSARLAAGAHRALDGAKVHGRLVEILGEYATPDWSPDKAQEWVAGQVTQFGSRVDAVVAANDGTAGGAIAALRAAGRVPVPPVTGQDAELAAVQRVVAGDQLMTVHKAFEQQARTAAELAVRVVRGEDPVAPGVIGGIKSFVLAPTSVERDDVERVIVDGRVHTTEQICTDPYLAACRDLGLVEEDDA